MIPNKTLEDQILLPAHRLLSELAISQDMRIDILEAAACRLGGFSIAEYRRRFGLSHKLTTEQAMAKADRVLTILHGCPIHPSLALSSLARPRTTLSQQRTSGAYYTDFRLALHVAGAAAHRLVAGARVFDPAAGSGILLVAASILACGQDRHRCSRWLAESVTAADLSVDALRGARLALASLTNDLVAVHEMNKRWRCEDSLFTDDSAKGAYDVVIGNPPWEKLKVTRHEFVKANGGDRHYGDDYGSIDAKSFSVRRSDASRYGLRLAERYPLLGSGEPDLYKAFLDLFLRLVRPEGFVSVLLPAGLIRSQGTEDLRRFLFANTGTLSFTVMENRARFFAIDTRFKFIGLSFTKAKDSTLRNDLRVVHARGTDQSVDEYGLAEIKKKVLSSIRADLTIPEVRSKREWRLFLSMSRQACRQPNIGDPWHAVIVREVDMTRDRQFFARYSRQKHLPLIEGRMVHQYRFGAKAYRSGTGRKAKWETISCGSSSLLPQFWYPSAHLNQSVLARTSTVRAGFCDITGQTNERSMMAALVVPGTVCGNKVPTVTFPNDPREDRLFLWIAIVNSLPFDWALRRTVTTTVNYFVLRGVPFPRLEPDSLPGRLLVEASCTLRDIDAGLMPADPIKIAELRASIDVSILIAYRLHFEDLVLMLKDFPLLDRGQPPLPGENRSTITRDYLLAYAARRLKQNGSNTYVQRSAKAIAIGAIPYVPSEFVLLRENIAIERNHA